MTAQVEEAASEAVAVGDGIAASTAQWSFGGNTPKEFDAHIRRSVPFYDLGHELVVKLSDFFVKSDSKCYELGTSTGTLTTRLARHHAGSVQWLGIDIEPRMISEARRCAESNGIANATFIVGDVSRYDFEPSDLIVAYYTVQFIPPRLRLEALSRIYRALNWGGALVMFEKVRGPDARFQDILTALYTDFKVANGYSPAEIIGKSNSLRGVLEPFSARGNLDLLGRAGFVDVMSIFRYLCFEGWLCIK